MRRGFALTVLALLCAGCASSLAAGEQRYREGDRRAALETWRQVSPDARDHAAVTARIEAVDRVRVIDALPGWSRVETADGTRGWVGEASILRTRP